MIRIAFVLPSFAAGGAERVVLTLLAALNRSRFHPYLIVLSDDGPLREIVPPDVKVIDLSRPRVRSALPALRRALRTLDPHIAFSTMAHMNMGLLALKPFLPGKLRLIVREANIPLAGLYGHKRWVFQIGYRRLYRTADKVVSPALCVMEDLRSLTIGNDCLIETIPNPIDVSVMRERAIPSKRHPGDGLRLVSAGRLTKQKGFDRLLNVMTEAAPDTHLLILGEGGERQALETQVQERRLTERIDMPGHCANPLPAIAGADLFVLPSRWEGLPNVVLEALTVGTPVLASPEAGGIGEIAALAPDAVSLAETDGFSEALANFVPIQDATKLTDSLLPDEYRISNVLARYEALFEAVAK